MKNFNIHILSKDIANIYINGAFVSLIDNYENFSIDLKMYDDSLIITKEPVSSQNLLLPYTVKLEARGNKIISGSDFLEIIPFNDNVWEVVLNECEIKNHKPLKKVYDEYIGNYNIIAVNDGTTYINIYENNNLMTNINTQELHNIFCDQKNGHIVIKALTNNSKYYLIILNQSFEELINCEVERIEEKENEIKVLIKINDIAKHAIVKTFNLNNSQTQDEYYVYLNQNAITTNEAKLVPYAFLEAIKVKNFSLAKKYLTKTLSDKTEDEHLEYYFKNIKSIHYNSYSTNNNLINYTILCDNYRNFNFSLINNKIDEIEEVYL